MQLWKARKVASDVLHLLSPYYVDALVCGSIRRGEREVKDIDIVLLSKVDVVERQPSLFAGELGDHIDRVDHLVNKLVCVQELDVGIEVVKVGASQHKLRHVQGIDIELYTVDHPSKMGIAIAFRTGPDLFSERLARFPLFLHWHITGYQLHKHEKGGRPEARTVCSLGSRCTWIVPTPTENDLFAALGLPYFRPEIRSEDILREAEREVLNLQPDTIWP